MTETARNALTSRRAWPFLLTRAVIAALAAAAITFTTGHSIHFGLGAFGGFALATGLVLARAALRYEHQRLLTGVQALVSVLAGVLSLSALGMDAPPTMLFVAVVAGWALLSGASELWRGWRLPARSQTRRDRIGAGALTVVLAVAVLVVPSDLHTVFSAPDGSHGAVTSAVALVGVLGAYAAIMAVYLAIGAVSLRGAGTAASADERSSDE